MSIAKKSVKWLVALFVIFALILTASVALGNVARASAEPEAAGEDTFIPLSVIAKGSVTGEAYPDLLSSSSDRTVTVEYYFDIPAAIEEDVLTEMKFDVYMTLPDNSTVKPTNIELNTAIASAVAMDALTNQAEEGYLDDAETAATEFAIELKTGHTMSELRGFTKSGTTYTLGNYFFKATYTVPASTDGVFSFDFGETSEVPANEALESEDAITYVPEVTRVTTDTVMDGIDDVTKVSTGIFYVRSYIDVPVAVPGLIFDNTQQTAIVDKDGYAYVIGDLVNDLYPVFYHDEWPAGFSLVPETYVGGVEAQQSHGTFVLNDKDYTIWRIPDGNDGYTYSTDNYTVNWEIAKRSITVPVSAGTTYTYNGQAQSFEFSEDPLTDAAYITITGTPQTNVGEYTVTAALTYPASTYWAADINDTADKEYDFIIDPALITVPTPANVTYTFNKTEQSFQWADTPDALITITGTPQTAAGEYTITASIPANYAWNDEGHTTADKTFPFVIAKKSVAVPSLEPSHFTYNGEEKSVSLVQAVADEGYIAERSTGTTWVATNAGEYAVKVGLQYPASTYWGDDTTDTADKTLNWDIGKVQITKPTPLDNVQYVYDSYNKQFMLDVVSAETGYYTISNNIRKNAGTQTVTVSLKDKTNTEWADGTTADLEFTFTVQRRPVNISVSADAASHVYGNTPANVSISMTGAIDAFSSSYKVVCVDGEAPYAEYTPTQFNEGLNAGHYTLNPVYNDINGNYDVTVSEPFSYEVIKREITIPTAISGLEYTGSAQVGVTKTDGSFYTLYSGSDEETAVGNYSATYRLNSTTNTYWAGDVTDVADKTVEWSIAKKSIAKPEISESYKTYNGESQSYSGSGTGYTFTGSGTNAGSYPVTVTLTDKDNSVWAGTDSAEDYEEADKLVINKKSVTISITKSASSSVYHDAIATITVNATGIVNEGDLGTISYRAKYSTGSAYQYYTKEEFESTDPYPIAKSYILEPTYTANDNYTVNASTSPYEITVKLITVPTVVTATYSYDGEVHSIEFSGIDADYVDVVYDSQSAIGVYADTTTVALKAAYAGGIAWDDANHTTAAKTYTLTIEVVEVNFTIVPIFNNTEKTGAATVQNVLTALPAATTYRWFKFTGYTLGGNAVSNVSLDMEGETVYANYSYNVGAGDADGDGVISSADVILLKRWNVGLDRAKKIADAATAWAKTDDSSVTSAVLYTALDANNNGAIRSNDVVAVREALATGRTYKVLVKNGIVQVAKANRVTVNSYEDLLGNIRLGNPVTLGTDIDAANEIFNEDSLIPVDIDLGTHRLTVKGFTLNTATAGATLKIAGDAVEGGTLYTVTGITVTAPNGNVIVSNVNGYSYDGTVVNLAAYSESLHIEDSVAFYIYKAQDPVTNEDYADVHAFVADVYPENVEQATVQEIADLNTTITTLATTRIGETAARMQDIATIKASDSSEADKATAINALDVKKAILEVPIDTHVVVEESAKLSADKIVVKAQSDTSAPAVTTFAIEVKNAAAEVVTVDISEVKDNTGEETVYVVNEVAISGASSQVEVVAGENTAADVKKYVAQIGTTSYETLQAAINAAQNADTIKLIADVADGTGLEIKDGTVKTITIDFNGKTYTMVTGSVGSTGTETQAMHWSNNSTVTLKNGTFVVSAQAATVAGSNGKVVKMAMQNYSALTVKNMTMDFSNIPVQNYGDYTGTEYEAYTGLEISLFNTNVGSINIEGSTITMPANSTKGICINIAGATITNSTINGAVSLNSDDADPSVTVTGSTITKGVVSYFAGYSVITEGNVYSLIDGVAVTNATELQAALDAGASKIQVMNDFNAPNPIAVSKSTIINGYDHTITSNGNRIMNVTDAGVVLTINDLTMTSATSERGLNIWDSATGSDITLNNVYIDAHLYAINYVNGADDATLVVNDSYLKGWGAINAHFNDSSVVVNNSTLYGINRTTDHTYGFSTVVIDGDSLNGSQEGDHGVDNTFVFDGCTIIAEVRDTHQYWISFQYAATGNTATVVVNNCEILDAPNGNDKSADMNIDGTNNAVVMALSAEQYAIVAAKHFNITDNGNGTYTIMPKTANISYFGTAYNFYDVFENGWLEDTEAFTLTDDVVLDVDVVFATNRAAAIAVSGGTFEMNLDGYTISGEGKILLPVGVTCVTDSNVSLASIFEAPEGEVIIESVDADGNYIYAVGVAYVKTKAEFTAAITAGAKKLVICADINLSLYTYNRDMDITIDLNGHTLTTTMTGITFSAARTLNIVDSSANGTGAINSTGNYAINMGTASTAATVINVYGGTLTGKTSAAVKVNDGTLNVYGGTLTCPAADKYAILNYQGYAGTVNIIGGTFTAAVAVANNGTGEVNIYGGTFSADPSDFVASGYMAVENEGTWTVVDAEITITTFAELKAAIADVNAGNIVYPTLVIANDIQFEEELTISKSVYIKGDGEVKFIGYDASTKYDEAFYINVADEDQEITIEGIVFDHFMYYSNVANKTKATASAVKNGVAYITYGGNCPASTTLYVTGCQFLGTARQMINVASTIGCKGYIVIEDCLFDATDRLMSTLNILEFYGNEDAELSVMITGCTFKEATEQNATWATSAIASFGNADITIDGCEFIACQVAIGIDNTFDRLFDTVTYPVYYNTTVTLGDNTYTNCYFGYYEESIVASVDDVPEGAELASETAAALADNKNAAYGNYYEYDIVENGTQGVDAKYLVVKSYYVAAMTVEGSGEGAQGDPGLDD